MTRVRFVDMATVAVAIERKPISWGAPAQEVQADLDEMCPRCGARIDAAIGLHFDFRRNGDGIRALCYVCDWAMYYGNPAFLLEK